MSKRILLIDDDALIRRSLSFHLQQAGYQVQTANSAEEGLKIFVNELFDLILLDIGLPGMDGLEALRHFGDLVKTPVIFITARRRELDEALGLELGADDYITKPFDTSVLLARIKAVLRRSIQKQPPIPINEAFSAGGFEIDPQTHTVKSNEKQINLTPIEFKLFITLARLPEKTFSVNELLSIVWGEAYIGQPQVVYVHMRALRSKIETNPDKPVRIINIRGVGYKFLEQEV
ncbi:MAG: response regulator transcription factor [Anaerolineaceae bacterium]|nr:response regulator transcription factor [Anaerolineaceae bacterium]